MSDPFFRPATAGASAGTSFDAGLRAHMQRVFNYMGGGLALTGAVAYLIANTSLANLFFAIGADGQVHSTILGMIGMLAPLAFVLYMQFRIRRMSLAALQIVFWSYCGLMGISIALICLAYSGSDVARAFFVTAADFAAISLYGYTTKRDLTGMGAFVMMGLLGLIIASVVNLFLHSSGLQWAMSIAGVGIFTGLTAYQVQAIKQSYDQSYGSDANSKMAVSGALSLYMSFINLFLSILRLMGNSRS